MAAHRRTRLWSTLIAATLVALALAYAFRPRPVMVDMGVVARAPMVVTIDEEAKTRVRDAYVVSAPVAGRLLRVEVEPGDAVEGGNTPIARMLPLNPSALDIRTREQARASVSAAEAALRAARADLNKAMADRDLAELDLARARKLRKSGTFSQAALDQAERTERAAEATLDMTRAAISMREADLANVRAHLIGFGEDDFAAADAATAAKPHDDANAIPLVAPVSGRILRVMQKSETTLAAGTPILEIGDVANDLEIVAELLSTDAVPVSVNDRVIIRNWGGAYPLAGVVERVEPWGFTKFSALGVEEQRVNVIIKFTDPLERRNSLGHGYRVETQIVVWEADDALVVPASALFRDGEAWSVFRVHEDRVQLTPVEVGRNNGVQAQLLAGLEAGDQVVLYPGPGLVDGARVARRLLD